MENQISTLSTIQQREKIEDAQFLNIQKSLYKERVKRMTIMSLLISALLFTITFGTIENPFQYTFSKIGNRFTVANRILFIVWANYTGFSIQSSVLALFRLENYKSKRNYIFIHTATAFLIISALSPSLDHLVFWTKIHLISAGLFALFLTLGFYPFIIWLARNNPRLKTTIYVWLSITWGGGIGWYFFLGNTGMFEIWFFGFFILFLLYLSLTLFEELIVKQSIILLRNENNLDQGIEDIFNNFEKDPA
jgi:hypothetical protein